MKKIILVASLLVLVFSCIKLEENDKRYSARKLQKMLEGTWELTDYQIDGISYLDTFLKVNTHWNCKNYTFTRWKNASGNKGPQDYKSGKLSADCQSSPSKGYFFSTKNKMLDLGGPYFRDSIYFFSNSSIIVLRLENEELILYGSVENHSRRIYFKKV